MSSGWPHTDHQLQGSTEGGRNDQPESSSSSTGRRNTALSVASYSSSDGVLSPAYPDYIIASYDDVQPPGRAATKPVPINVTRANAWKQHRLPHVAPSASPQDPFATPTTASHAQDRPTPVVESADMELGPPTYAASIAARSQHSDERDEKRSTRPTSQVAALDTPTIKPSLRLVYGQLTLRDTILLVVPGVLLAVAGGIVPTMMAKVIGKAFDAFTAYNPTGLPSHAIEQAAKDRLMRKILETVYILLGLAAATVLSSTLMISTWVCIGERVAKRLRTRVFAATMSKKMAWFDCGMGMETAEGAKGGEMDQDQEEGGIGPGGLMAKFVREIDDVRMAASRVSGELVQSFATCGSGLVYAFISSWSLTLVILASIPVSIVVTILCEVFAAPLLQKERKTTAQASGLLERTVLAINTVKAFNAEAKERQRFAALLDEASSAYRKVIVVWAARFGLSSTLALSMFVQGFWYGSHLVQKGKMSAGTVMSVFFSCLLVAGELVQVVESLNWIEKGKIGAANMEKLLQDSHTERQGTDAVSSPAPSSRPGSGSETKYSSGTSTIDSIPMTPLSYSPDKETLTAVPVSALTSKRRGAKAVPLSLESIPHPVALSRRKSGPPSSPSPYKLRYGKGLRVQPMRRARPSSCQGEIVLRNISFSYPSRPDVRVLKDVDMFFPAAEITYVVGGSGSGKSTIAQLLTRIYEPTKGSIELDDQMLAFLDPAWCKEHIASVSQTPIVFDLSVHENVALGLVGSPAERRGEFEVDTGSRKIPILSREEVQAACRVALLHDFIRDLPDGYDTKLGQRGANLSGGQKQRLAIARARVRDPTVLILDEATSALDPTSRLLVHEAIKRWRRGKTTIVITHDLSQVSEDDFVYFLEKGRVAEQGYRNQLERSTTGRFRALLDLQQSAANEDDNGAAADSTEDEVPSPWSPTGLEVQSQCALEAQQLQQTFQAGHRRTQRLSTMPLLQFQGNPDDRLQEGPTAALLSAFQRGRGETETLQERHKTSQPVDEGAARGYLDDASRLEASGLSASRKRLNSDSASGRRDRRRWQDTELQHAAVKGRGLEQVKVLSRSEEDDKTLQARGDPKIRHIVRIVWRTVPSRLVLVLGLAACAAGGCLTPCFSFLLAQLLNTMGQQDPGGAVLRYSLLVLMLAGLEGIFGFLRTITMHLLADRWVRNMRTQAYNNILSQDRTFFDMPSSSTGDLCTSIVKDAEDARNLIASIAGQVALVIAMITLGLLWAVVVGWQLTLAGLAIAPIFFGCIYAQNRAVVLYEGRNKIKREEVGKRFYDMVSNIRGIRSMGLESVFENNFTDAVLEAQRCGMRAAAVTGLGFGLGQSLTYVAEAVMFLVGAVLITRGLFDFAKMMQVFNLIIFAVTFAAHAMDALPNLSKSMRATLDLDRLLRLSDTTSETPGLSMPVIQGGLRFEDVGFRYETRKEVPVLNGTSFEVRAGECLAIVGGSGSGKSTIAALLQRLYQPSSGAIYLDGQRLDSISTSYLREHVSVVSQHPNLFDMSIGENIVYGANATVYDSVPPTMTASTKMDETTFSRVQEAAKQASVNEFVDQLPNGYSTSVGDSGGLISGGQAQRIAVARALMRTRARLLILDEFTSALDVENQEAIASTLLEGRVRRERSMTTLVITHNVDIMKRCDSILVLQDGAVVQRGTFANLMKERGGVFATLARGGEWAS